MMIRTMAGHTWLTFKNGITISIFNGYGSYSDNHFDLEKINQNVIESNTCEIAIRKDDKFITKKFGFSNDVIPNVTSDELAEIITMIRHIRKEDI